VHKKSSDRPQERTRSLREVTLFLPHFDATEVGVGTEGLEPWGMSHVARLLRVPQHRANASASFGGVAPVAHRRFDCGIRISLTSDLPVQAINREIQLARAPTTATCHALLNTPILMCRSHRLPRQRRLFSAPSCFFVPPPPSVVMTSAAPSPLPFCRDPIGVNSAGSLQADGSADERTGPSTRALRRTCSGWRT